MLDLFERVLWSTKNAAAIFVHESCSFVAVFKRLPLGRAEDPDNILVLPPFEAVGDLSPRLLFGRGQMERHDDAPLRAIKLLTVLTRRSFAEPPLGVQRHQPFF